MKTRFVAMRNRVSASARRVRGSVLLASALLVPAGAVSQDYSIDWHTIDGGGEMFSETADQAWQLSGTLGQWDSTESLELAGGGYTLTGGFWPATVDETDRLFSDGFEGAGLIR